MNRKQDFDTALDESLNALRAGASVEDCLARFPQYAEALRPMLEMASSISEVRLPQPSEAARRRSRERMLREAEQHQFAKQAVSISAFSRYVGKFINLLTGKDVIDMKTTTRFAIAVLVLVLLVVSGLGVNFASANALPGDVLYPAKRFFEQTRLALTLDPETHRTLELELQERRREEVRAVMEMQRQVEVNFEGELTAFDDTTWTVGGFRLSLAEYTQIEGTPAPGVMVNVQARLGKNGLQAERLIVRLRNQQMTTGGAYPYPAPDNTSEPSPMPSHTPRATPMPSHTPWSSPMPSHTPQASPMPSHTPQATPMPSHTPWSSPMPSHTPWSSPMPSHTPQATPMPRHTPQASPMPSHTPQASPMPSHTPWSSPMPSHTPWSSPMPSHTPWSSPMPTMPGGPGHP